MESISGAVLPLWQSLNFLLTWKNSPGSWRVYAHSLLCNTEGSNAEKALEILERLREDFDNANWIVFVSDSGSKPSFSQSTGDKVWHEDTCGKSMYVWRRDTSWDYSLFTKTSCTTVEQSQMRTLMRAAAADGGGTSAVRDRLRLDIENFGYDFKFMSVAIEDSQLNPTNAGDWQIVHHVYPTCRVELSSNGYAIYVYMW